MGQVLELTIREWILLKNRLLELKWDKHPEVQQSKMICQDQDNTTKTMALKEVFLLVKKQEKENMEIQIFQDQDNTIRLQTKERQFRLE